MRPESRMAGHLFHTVMEWLSARKSLALDYREPRFEIDHNATPEYLQSA